MHHPPARTLFVTSLFLAIVALVFVMARGWSSKATALSVSPSLPVKTQVELARVKVGGITETVHAVGTLEANESVMIRPEIPGLIREVLFTEGQAVEKGMILIKLDDSELRAQLEQAAAELKIARLTYNRMKDLGVVHNPFVSQQQLDEVMNKFGTAQANHAFYLARLGKTMIRAPFTGYVGIRRVSPGDYVQPGQDLVNIEDLRTLKIDFKIPETYLNRLSVGQEVDIHTDAGPDQPFAGTVYVLDPRVDSSSRAIRARATIPNADTRLRPGLFAEVDVVVGRRDDALLIPEESLIVQRDKTFVYRVIDQTARWTEVTLGVREQGLVQVLDGLDSHDSVVRAGHQKLKDGMLVAATTEQ